MKFVKDTVESMACRYAFELTDENYAPFVEVMVEYINAYMPPALHFVPVKAADFSMDLLKAIWCGDEGDNVPEWVMKEYKDEEYGAYYSVYDCVRFYLDEEVYDHLDEREYGDFEDEENLVED